MGKRINLVEVIKANPGCVAVIDNDCWWLYRRDPADNPHDEHAAQDEWAAANELADYATVEDLGDGGYGSGSNYGGDILQALAIIVGVKIQSV